MSESKPVQSPCVRPNAQPCPEQSPSVARGVTLSHCHTVTQVIHGSSCVGNCLFFHLLFAVELLCIKIHIAQNICDTLVMPQGQQLKPSVLIKT